MRAMIIVLNLLNPEMSATFNDSAKERDEYFRSEQNLVNTALAASLGTATPIRI